MRPELLSLVVLLNAALASQAQDIQFRDVTASSGIDNNFQSHGISLADVNGDGFLDIYVGNHFQTGSLYINRKNGVFADSSALLIGNEKTDTHGGFWGDFDSDGDLDLIVTSGAERGEGERKSLFFLHEDGNLVESAAHFGLDYPVARGRYPLMLDYNHDSYLDFFLINAERPDGQGPSAIFVYDTLSSTYIPSDTLGYDGHFALQSKLFDDGKDYLLYFHRNGTNVYLMDSSKLTNVSDEVSFPAYARGDLVFGDFNNDGLQDLFRTATPTLSDIRVRDSIMSVSINSRPGTNETSIRFKTSNRITLSIYSRSSLKSSEIYVGGKGTNPSDNEITLLSSDFRWHQLPKKYGSAGRGLFVRYDNQLGYWDFRMYNRFKSRFLDFKVISDSAIYAVDTTNFVKGSNTLGVFLNNGNEFVEYTDKSDLQADEAFPSAVSGDFDNDGDLDIYVISSSRVASNPHYLLINNGRGRFEQIKNPVGKQVSGRPESVAVGDYDNDGLLDLFITNGEGPKFFEPGPIQVIQNSTKNDNNWIQFDIQGRPENREALGAKLELYTKGRYQMREVNGGVHKKSQNFKRIHFGLRRASEAKILIVKWPNDDLEAFPHLKANEIHDIVQGEGDSVALKKETVAICPGESYLDLETPGLHFVKTSEGGAEYFRQIEIEHLPTNTTLQKASICDGDAISVGDSTFYSAGSYQVTLTNTFGCDSVIHLEIELLPVDTTYQQASICAGDSVVLGDSTFYSSGSYQIPLTSTFGCDSIIHLEVEELPTDTTYQQASICTGDSIVIANSTFYNAGSYQVVLTNTFGCDSIIEVEIMELSVDTTYQQASICAGDSIVIANSTFYNAGSYQVVLTNTFGCDSIIEVEIMALPVDTTYQQASICAGDSVVIGDSTFYDGGTYHIPLTNTLGCDSIIHLEIEKTPIDTTFQKAFICGGDSVEIAKSIFYAPGSYEITLTNTFGCDSIIHLEIEEHIADTTYQQAVVCVGDSIVVGDTSFFNAGSYEIPLTNTLGCDSIVKLAIIQLPGDTTFQRVSLCDGDSLVFGDATFNRPGSYQVPSVNSFGCPSILELEIEPCIITGIEDELEQSYIYPNPATDHIIVDPRVESIQIFSIDGRKEFTRMSLTSNEIDISDLPSGLKFIRLQLRGGESVVVKMLVQ